MTPSIPSINGNAAAYPTVEMSGKNAGDGMTIRLVLAAQFAATWIEKFGSRADGIEKQIAAICVDANRVGIAQADDLIAQLNREAK